MIHVVDYLRELKEPLIPVDLYVPMMALTGNHELNLPVKETHPTK
jgi:hypothetical protein